MYTEYLNKIAIEAKLRNLTDSTAKAYTGCVSQFLTRTNKTPDTLTAEDVRNFLLIKAHEGLKPRTFNFIIRPFISFFVMFCNSLGMSTQFQE